LNERDPDLNNSYALIDNPNVLHHVESFDPRINMKSHLSQQKDKAPNFNLEEKNIESQFDQKRCSRNSKASSSAMTASFKNLNRDRLDVGDENEEMP